MSGLCNLGFVDKPTNLLVFVCVVASLPTTSCTDVESGALSQMFSSEVVWDKTRARIFLVDVSWLSLHSVGSFFVGFRGILGKSVAPVLEINSPRPVFHTNEKNTTLKHWETEGRSTIAAYLTVISVLGWSFLKGQGQGSENIATYSLQVLKCKHIWVCILCVCTVFECARKTATLLYKKSSPRTGVTE